MAPHGASAGWVSEIAWRGPSEPGHAGGGAARLSWKSKSNLAWLRALPGIEADEPLASRTSFGIGGPADFFLELARPEAIEKGIDGCRERGIPYLLLGPGPTSWSPTAASRAWSSAWSIASTRSRARVCAPERA